MGPQCVAMLFNYFPYWSFQLKNLIGFYNYGNENKEGNQTLLLIKEKKTEMPRPFCLTFR